MNAKTAKETTVYFISHNGKIVPATLFDFVMGCFKRGRYVILPFTSNRLTFLAYDNGKTIAECDTYDEAEQANFDSAYNNYLENCKQAYNTKTDALEAIAEQKECCIADAEQIESGELYYKVSPYDTFDETEDEIFYSLKEAIDYFTNPANPNTQLTRHYCGKQTWWDESHFNNEQLKKLKPFINKKFCRKFTLKTPNA